LGVSAKGGDELEKRRGAKEVVKKRGAENIVPLERPANRHIKATVH